ncbi:unnamed protein product, partial [Allacma fusca]
NLQDFTPNFILKLKPYEMSSLGSPGTASLTVVY